MRKSFGGSYGGGNGGKMLRNAGRVARTRLNNFQESLPSQNSSATIKKPSSSSSTKTNQTSSKHALSLSSSSPNDNNNGMTVHMSTSWPANDGYFINGGVNEGDYYNEVGSEWECFENYYDPIFGVVPSTREVQHALLSLQGALRPQTPHSCSQSTTEEIPCEVDKDIDDQTKTDIGILQRLSSKGSESSDSDWFEPSMHPYNHKLTLSPGWGRVHDAFHLLENEPSVQRMVVSLSSDKAVWDAVLNNEAVREIRDSYRNAAESSPPSSDEKLIPSEANLSILKWIFENMRIKLMEIIGSISEYVGDTFKSHDPDKGEHSYAFTEKLRSTFLLTVVVLLIVVVARGRMA